MKFPRSKSVRPRHVRMLGIVMAASLTAVVVGVTPSASAQTVGSLKERAKKLAAELDALDQRTNALDEEYNSATFELDGLKAKLAANEAEVANSRTELTATRGQAQAVAVQAYIGNNDKSELIGIGDDVATDSRRKVFLGTRYSDSQQVIDSLVAAQKDLADREAALAAASAKVDAKVNQVKKATADLDQLISNRKALYESVSGELATAMKAEQERLAREAAARAERDARAAAAAAQAARRPKSVALSIAAAPAGSGGAARLGVAAPAAAPARALTPPPANAPTAVRVAMEQQGDPYRWAASGPDSFDCSGLVMFAYKAAGISLPHSSRALRSMTRSLSADELQPGDLVFGGSPVHHVGIYIGNGQMVHSPHSGTDVQVSSMYQTSKPVAFGRL